EPPQLSTLSLHDALPISWWSAVRWTHGRHARSRTFPRNKDHPRSCSPRAPQVAPCIPMLGYGDSRRLRAGQKVAARTEPETASRSEEHTSELQSPDHLVC